jgi:hypothetical protein
MTTQAQAFLIRGLGGYWSQGLDVLAKRLPEELHPIVLNHEQASQVLPSIKKLTNLTPILIGHSQGANEAVKIANQLSYVPTVVPLLATIDPVFTMNWLFRTTIGENVKHCINQSTSIWGSYLYPQKGFTGRIENINLPGEWHIHADDSTIVQDRILRAIDKALGRPSKT